MTKLFLDWGSIILHLLFILIFSIDGFYNIFRKVGWRTTIYWGKVEWSKNILFHHAVFYYILSAYLLLARCSSVFIPTRVAINRTTFLWDSLLWESLSQKLKIKSHLFSSETWISALKFPKDTASLSALLFFFKLSTVKIVLFIFLILHKNSWSLHLTP